MRSRLAASVLLALALPALALGSHKEPEKRLTPADQRKAASVVLKRADFTAGWKKTSTPDEDTHYDCAGYDPNGSDLVMTGEAEADFEHPQGFPAVFSFANVYKSRANAVAAWTRSVKPAMAACLSTIFKDGLATQEGVTAAITGRGTIAFPKVAPRTAAFRISLRLTVTSNGKRTQVPLTIHVVALGNGRAEAGLMTLAPGKGLALADVRAFARVLAQRLAAAKL